MWVEFVVGSRPCSEGFSPGPPVFLPPQKSTLLNSNSIGNSRATGLSVSDCYVLPSLNKVVTKYYYYHYHYHYHHHYYYYYALSREGLAIFTHFQVRLGMFLWKLTGSARIFLNIIHWNHYSGKHLLDSLISFRFHWQHIVTLLCLKKSSQISDVTTHINASSQPLPWSASAWSPIWPFPCYNVTLKKPWWIIKTMYISTRHNARRKGCISQ